MSDVAARLNRLFDPDSKRCLDIAVDHGFFGEAAFLPGIEDLRSAVDTLIQAAPDAIQLTVGQARLLQGRGGRERPAQPRVREACLRAVLDAKRDCERYNMPLMVEPLVMKESSTGGYGVNGDVSKIVPLVRQAVELGADIIKADPTDDPDDYHEVIRIATGIPVLVRGGGRVPDEELFRRTEAVLGQGASGIVYGRNIIQHPNPAGMTRALMAMLHKGVDAAGALAILAAAS